MPVKGKKIRHLWGADNAKIILYGYYINLLKFHKINQ